ncbi:ferrochelatase [Pseudonocardia sp. TMWB2A]|uniref:ferrochelatase n=1 Tax=Pseudonocardia sp. TMWB2A TaxID=687430 RepID=UPI00307CCC66
MTLSPPADTARKIGVLLVNLGTPDAPDPASVRRYLKQFLSDPRVVEIPQLLWQPILRGAVLTTRPKKSAHAYAQVWTEAGSPLLAITKAQAQDLQARLGDAAIHVDYAMRYGNPAIPERLAAMKQAGCARILIAPLYPQYCAATTATALDECYRALAAMRWQPAVRTLPPYYADPAHIAALKTSVEAALAALDFTPDAIVASFHGMPARTYALGDPYYDHCLETARLLSDALGRPLIPTFQSRFGKAKWLEPYTDASLVRLATEGSRKVAILAPGFSVDCLETLEELAIRGKAQFIEAGGTDFAYLPCLNADTPGMAMLETLMRRELAGWV